MRKKTVLLIILMGLFTFYMNDIKVLAVETYAKGEYVPSDSGGSCEGHTTCANGDSATVITIDPVEGAGLKGVEFVLTADMMKKLETSPPLNFALDTNTDPQHAIDWKATIAGLGSVVNGDKEAIPLQEEILNQLASANEMSVEEFMDVYRTVAKQNNHVFNYTDTPMAYVWNKETGEGGYFSNYNECVQTLGDSYGCWAVKWANNACGKEDCIGWDKDQMKETKSCMERLGDAYLCCMEIYNDENVCKPDNPNTPSNGASCGEPVSPNLVSPPTIPQDSSSGIVGCGETYTTEKYSTGSTSCPYVKTLITVTRTEEYPGIFGNYEVGEQLNFSNVVHWYSTRTEKAWDDSELQNEIAIAQSIIDSIDAEVDCLEKEIAQLKTEIAAVEQELIECEACVETCIDGDWVPNGIVDPVTGLEDKDWNCYEYSKCPDCGHYYPEISNLESQIADIEKQIEGLLNSPAYTGAHERIKELNECGDRGWSFKSTSTSSSGSYTLGNSYLHLNDYKQTINSIKGIAKNSGKLLTKQDLENFKFPYFPNNSSFVIPIQTKNGTSGEVVAVSNGNALYSCPIGVRNMFYCKDNNCGSGGLNVIYRPISLTNPFPNLINNNKYRKMGANWNETYAQTVIENNRGVSNYDIYKTTPIYTIELTPAKIKEIRKYNDKTSFNNFDMKCSDGYLCSSNFLWRDTTNGYNFSDIVVQSESCATSDGWSNCYGGDA